MFSAAAACPGLRDDANVQSHLRINTMGHTVNTSTSTVPQAGEESIPLAERLRPTDLTQFVGQNSLIGPDGPLRMSLTSGHLCSLLLWGPPGTGKTTLAKIIAAQSEAEIFQLNAVTSGVKDVKQVIEVARTSKEALKRDSILFIDEIHRFNKAQQDVLLHSVEDGTIFMIGATTENPSFEVIAPLLSRCRVCRLEPLTHEDLDNILERALTTDSKILSLNVEISGDSRDLLIAYSGGDARMLLNTLEFAARTFSPDEEGRRILTGEHIEHTLMSKVLMYDKKGDYHYDMISAFIKSVRGSDPDAALYWMARILEGGEEPKFIARRMIILASEDIGNADPYALTLATSAFTAVTYIGLPEARLILAQTATYLASAPKSNASYTALQKAAEDLRGGANDPVPLHLRNAPTKHMKSWGYGKDYKYSHDASGNFIRQDYLPERLKGRVYYHPTENGAERKIRERLLTWWPDRQRKV